MLQLVVEELIEATIRQRYESARWRRAPAMQLEGTQGPLGDEALFTRPPAPERGRHVERRAKGAKGRCRARKARDAAT